MTFGLMIRRWCAGAEVIYEEDLSLGKARVPDI